MSSRKIAVEVITSIFEKGTYSNIILSQELNKSNLGDKDKGLVTEIVYGTLKYKYTIDVILKHFLDKNFIKLEALILNTLRIAVYQIKYLDKIPEFAAVNESVELAKKFSGVGASKLVNGVLRNYLRNKEESIYYKESNKIDSLCFKYSFEKWMVELFIKQYSFEVTEKILQGLNFVPEVTVRVNNMKLSYEDAFEELTENGYNINEGYACPEAIRIFKGKNIEKNPLFYEGKLTVQDESAMLVAPSMDLKMGLVVLDLCSAPGGKTTHIAEILENTGSVKAFDIHENKLKLIEENSKRLGLTNIQCGVMDAEKFNEKYVDYADRILIDVPCSGLGIIRKKPEIKWTKTDKQLKSVVKAQKNILKNASEYLKKDGILIYSTCTLNKSENMEIINEFIKNNNNFIIEPLFLGKLDNIIYHKEGYVTILPNENMDGFFIAKLRKI